MFGKDLNLPARTCAFSFALVLFLASQCLSGAGYGAARPQEQQGQALGSLTTVGEVYVNDATAPADSTIFAGDTLRTSGTGTAMFTLSGKGSFQISPNTEIAFAGGPQYAAELKFGKVVMSSLNGATGINLRTGSSVVVAVAEGEQSTSNIEAPSDGSFAVTCVSGSVGIIPLGGGKGILIRMGQSASISAQGELSSTTREGLGVKPEAARLAAPISEEPVPAARRRHGYMRWVLIGAGVAGAGVAAAILTANGSGASSNVPTTSTISPSSGSFPLSDPTPINPPAPSQPTPAPPSQPSPAPQPPPPGHNCPHDDKSCKPHVVVGLAFHF